MLKINNLSLRHRNQEWIFLGANLEIAGGVWLLEGDNGTGKSTLLQYIYQGGVNNQKQFEVNGDSMCEIPRNIILLDNKTNIPNVTENDCAKFVFKINNIKVNDYVPIYDDRKLALYSTGEKKIAILNIISYLNPEVLLLDEFVSNFDDENLEFAFRIINHMSKKGTIVIVASNEKDIKERFSNHCMIEDKKLILFEVK